MRRLFGILMLCALCTLCACSQPRSFSSKMQFLIPVQPEHWPTVIAELDLIMPRSMYAGKEGEVVQTPGAKPILYAEKTTTDDRYKIIVAQRQGKEKLSIVLYVNDDCRRCDDWMNEANRVKHVLHARYGDVVTESIGQIPYNPF